MSFRTDDPVYDHALYEAQRERMLDRYPVCAHCGEPITDERLFDVDGELYHVSCAEGEFQKWTEDYVE